MYSWTSSVECDGILESQQLVDICNLLLFNRPNYFELLCQATSLIQVQWSLDWYPNSPHRFLIFFVSSHLLITVLLIRFFVSSTKNVSTLRRLMILRMGPKNPQWCPHPLASVLYEVERMLQPGMLQYIHLECHSYFVQVVEVIN